MWGGECLKQTFNLSLETTVTCEAGKSRLSLMHAFYASGVHVGHNAEEKWNGRGLLDHLWHLFPCLNSWSHLQISNAHFLPLNFLLCFWNIREEGDISLRERSPTLFSNSVLDGTLLCFTKNKVRPFLFKEIKFVPNCIFFKKLKAFIVPDTPMMQFWELYEDINRHRIAQPPAEKQGSNAL